MLSIRKLGIVGRSYRHFNRYRQILAVAIKYGFDELIEGLGLDQYLETGLRVISKKDREQAEKFSRAERVRLVLEELGPTFIKLGQVLSTQPGLIPLDVAEELTSLQDNVPACDFAPIGEVIKEALGAPAEEIFDSFETTPIASASIAQVYAARLPDGQKVAVKVQRPGIKKIVEVDLEIMLYLATLMERHIEEVAPHAPSAIVKEFARVLEKELDFNIEASSMEQFTSLFAGDSTIHIPRLWRDYTTSNVLTMEYIEGAKLSDFDLLTAPKYNKSKITSRLADIMFKQIFQHGFFHADPHPGNVFVLPGNVVCMLDFGMVGSVDLRRRELFVDLMFGLARKNVPDVLQALLQLTSWDKKPDLDDLTLDITEFMGRHLHKPIQELEISKGLQDLLHILSHHQLRFPSNIFLMIKAFGTLEGIARQLDPEIDLITYATPFLAKVKLGRLAPTRIAGELWRTATDWRNFIQQLPSDLQEISRLLLDDKISLNVQHKGLAPLITKLDQISNRLSFSLIIASLLIGSSLIIAAQIPPLVLGISLLGLVGFAGAAVLWFWVLLAVLRRGGL